MFLHIGGDMVIEMAKLVMILDARMLDGSAESAAYVARMRAAGRVEAVAEGQAKSYIICTDKVYASPISAATLRRRAGLLDLAHTV